VKRGRRRARLAKELAVITVAVAAAVSAGAWLFGSEGGGGLEAATPHPFAVAEVVDGDTIRLLNGRRVRLLQIDAPELGLARECYGASSRLQLARMLTGHVRLEFDPALDRVDRYGRQLAYVFVGRTNVNLSMVRRGAARTSFYGSERGKYSKRLVRAERAARAARRGLWGACKRPRPIVARPVPPRPLPVPAPPPPQDRPAPARPPFPALTPDDPSDSGPGETVTEAEDDTSDEAPPGEDDLDPDEDG
jgi:micrococcal nuclease